MSVCVYIPNEPWTLFTYTTYQQVRPGASRCAECSVLEFLERPNLILYFKKSFCIKYNFFLLFLSFRKRTAKVKLKLEFSVWMIDSNIERFVLDR